MNLNELHSFKLSDAIKFHKELNPKLWKNDQLDPLVKKQLLVIAEDFVEELGIDDLDVVDITISGSNAAYTYTDHSDLDLHILVNMSELHQDAIYRELFRAKKTLYNDTHDITVHGIPVELYVQDSAEPVVSLGEYSILHDKWIKVPVRRAAKLDQSAAKAKFDQLKDLIDVALKTRHSKKITKALALIKRYRQAGLDKGGEFSPENLAYKAVRSQGAMDALYAMRDQLHSAELTIEEGYAGAKMKFLKPGELRGSHTPAKLMSLGFKKSQNGSWFILQSKWDELRKTGQLYETDVVTERLRKEFEDYDPNGKPPGPEFKPTMPAGTVKVDVSDVYDWYKLGQHVSNLKGLGKHDFGKGPPSTILSFGDEETEHQYIKDLEKTGLSTTDIDPVDVNQPKGMKRQKTDPTYNVGSSTDDLDESKNDTISYSDAEKLFDKHLAASQDAYDRKDQAADTAHGDFAEELATQLLKNEGAPTIQLKSVLSRSARLFDKYPIPTNWEPLDESLDSRPYPYRQVRSTDRITRYYFTTDYDDLPYTVMITSYPGDRIRVEFSKQKSSLSAFSDFGITGTGDARKVFATVIEIVKKYVDEHHPANITFTASEPSRIRLYDAFLKRLDRALPDYEGRSGPGPVSDGTYFYLKLKNPPLDEALDSQPYPYTSIIGTTGAHEYAFTTDNDNKYEAIIINQKYGIHVSFYLKQKQHDNGQTITRTGITGTGDARKVFATVIDIVKKFAAAEKPEAIVFTASEPSRIRLYDAFVKRLDRELPEYAEVRKEKGMAEWFVLKRKTENLDEATDRDSAIKQILKLQNTKGRAPSEVESSKAIIAKLMKRYNIHPKELRPVERNPYQDRISQARAERDVAGDMLKAEWDRFKGGAKDKVSGIFKENYDIEDPDETTNWWEDPRQWHPGDLSYDDLVRMTSGTNPGQTPLMTPLKVKIDEWDGQPKGTYGIKEFRKVSFGVAKLVIVDNGQQLTTGIMLDDPDTHLDRNNNIRENLEFYHGKYKIPAVEAFNIFQLQQHTASPKPPVPKIPQIATKWEPLDEDFEWQDDPMNWHGNDKDPTPYQGLLRKRVKMSLPEVYPEGHKYFIQVFYKNSPTTAVLVYTRNSSDVGRMRREIDFDAHTRGEVPEIFWWGDMTLTAEEAFNLYQLQKRNWNGKIAWKSADKQKTKWEPLDEALDSEPYPYEIEEDSIAWQISNFTTSDRNRYKVWLSKHSNKEVSVEFALQGDDDIDIDIENGVGIKNTGDARRVFATVIEIVKRYANKYKPNMITFSSDHKEPSRMRLYGALVKRADRLLPDYRDVSGEITGSWDDYVLARKGYQVNEASGYIPSKKEANDPRFKTALTVDVKPDSIQKNAKAFGSKTSRAGIPPTARADGKI